MNLKTIKRENFLWLFTGLICLFLACISTCYDYDLFARLIVGYNFIEHGILPYNDFLSYTPTHPWYDHEWGSGVVFYSILKYFGPIGFILFQSLMVFGTAFFIGKIQKLQNPKYPSSLIFISTFIVLFYGMNFSLVRCQLFSFLFFTIFLFILEKHRKTKTKLIWLIPFLTVFWNNLHGGVVSGLGIIFIYFIGSLLSKEKDFDYIKVLLISTVLLIINPYGIKYLKFLIIATTMSREYIVEWWSSICARHFGTFFLQILFITIGLSSSFFDVIKRKNLNYTKLLILLITYTEAIMHLKLMSLALITTSALCYSDFIKVFKFLRKLIIKIEKTFYIVILIFSITIPLYSPTVPRADFKKFPLKEVEFLKINNIQGNIVSMFGFGSYISYKLYPNNLIFMDGRYEEVYNNKEFMVLRDFEIANDNWEDIAKKYPTKILMPTQIQE